MGLDISNVDGSFAIEVSGVDLRTPLSDEDFAAIRDAWFHSGVMVIRDQHLSPSEQVAFSRRFGELGIHVLDQFAHPEQKEVLVLSNKKHPDGSAVGFEDAGRYWHSDLSYVEKPMLGTMLLAIEIPPEGGDTHFADMRAALATLPAESRERIEGRRAFHSYTRDQKAKESVEGMRPILSEEQAAKVPDVVHPMIRTHEDTGEKALFINHGFTFAVEDMEDEDGKELLGELFAHATQPELIYVHKWQPHDFLCWDNRIVMHHATTYDTKYTRHMHRTTIEGGVPV